MSTARGRMLLILVLLVVAVMVWLAARDTDWSAMTVAIGQLAFWQLGVMLVLSLINYVLRALRWRLGLRALGLRTRFGQDLVTYVGGFGMTLTPGRLGELVRLRWVQRDAGGGFAKVAPMALIDRASELASVALLLALCLMLSTGSLGHAWPAACLAVAIAVAITRPQLMIRCCEIGWRVTGRRTGRLARLFGTLRRAAQGLWVFNDLRVVIPMLMLGLFGWLAEGYAFALLLGWLGAPMDIWLAAGIFMFAMLGGGVTGMPGGLGGTEAAMLALLTIAGVSLEIALPATLIIRATTLWFAILLGLLILPLAERGKA